MTFESWIKKMHSGGKAASSINANRKIAYPRTKRVKLDPIFYHTQDQLKVDLNMKLKNLKKTLRNHLDTSLSHILDLILRAKARKAKLSVRLHQAKTILHSQDTVNSLKSNQ